MPNRLLSLTDVATESGIAKHKIVYALGSGQIQEPQRLKNRRCFSPRDLERIKTFFHGRAPR